MINGLILNERELRELEGLEQRRRIARREMLFIDGEAPDAAFVVLKGSFRLFKTAPGGQEQILDLALPGALLGVTALLTGSPYSASATAREPSEVGVIEAARFGAFLERRPAAAVALAGMLGRQLQEARQELLERSAAPAASRLARLLGQLEDLHRPLDRALRVTGQELASMIGAAPETVSRLLKKFTDLGALQRQGRLIQIRDRGGLDRAAVGA